VTNMEEQRANGGKSNGCLLTINSQNNCDDKDKSMAFGYKMASDFIVICSGTFTNARRVPAGSTHL
jgi:hypothetical protein